MPTYAFVDQIAASPTILFDLDNQSPFSVVVGTQTSPPTKRYSTISSTARDGDTVAQSSYSDRVLNIALRVELTTTAEQQVEGIQKLNRLLDAEQWLMWQHDTMIEPVFFRTRRADLAIDDSIMADLPKRTITLTIPAEPFAYGLPVTGTATIANDPSLPASSNPMSYAFPDIQGDVATPLSIATDTMAAAATTAVPVASVSPMPAYATAFTLVNDAGGDWVKTTPSVTGSIGATTTRIARTAGTNPATVSYSIANLCPGDYRVFARVVSTTATVANAGTLSNPAVVPADLLGPKKANGSTRGWVDLGVTRLPFANPDTSGPFAASQRTSPAVGYARIDGNVSGAASMDVDAVVLFPAGTDEGLLTRYARMRVNTTAISGLTFDTMLLDGEQNALTTGVTATGVRRNGILAGTGRLSLLPSAKNVLHLLRSVDTGGADSKSTTTTITWTYRPRYLYVRPATS